MVMHPNETAINEYVEGTLDSSRRADLEQRPASSVPCRQTVEDLREILRATGRLEPREPPMRVWSRLERAIKLEPSVARGVQSIGGGSGAPTPATRSLEPRWAAAAAAIVLASAIGLRFAPSLRDASRVPPDAAAA